MKQPKKWRDTFDINKIKFKNFKLNKVLGYPHAGNDVFYVNGEFQNKNINAFLKVERQNGADIKNEVDIIKKIQIKEKPEILEYSLREKPYILTKEIEGERLSYLLESNKGLRSITFMKDYGRFLAKIHSFNLDVGVVKHRKFFDLPEKEYFLNFNIEPMYDFLIKSKSFNKEECFVHGDFHYANILWENEKISGVLDYELSGYGIKEFDIAWSIFLRPGQKFLDTVEEIEMFFMGYEEEGNFSKKAFIYYYVLIASYFYSMGDEVYREKLKSFLFTNLIKTVKL